MWVEVLRNKSIESRHKIYACVVNARGEILFQTTDSFLFFPRSAMKPLQSHLLIDSGAFRALNLDLRHLAVATASHAGEKIHTDLVGDWLEKMKFDAQALRCGTHWPYDTRTSDQMKEQKQKPSNLHNNCSGKHTGILSVCLHQGLSWENYHLSDHPVQQMLKKKMEELLEQDLSIFGIDGCSLPTFEMDFYTFCKSFARLAQHAKEDSTSPAGLIFQSFRQYPQLTAGTERFCTQIMEKNPGRLLCKEGAEGVVVTAIPDKELAILVKSEDGAKRASEAAMDFLLQKYADAQPVFNAEIRNWVGSLTGEIRVNEMKES